MGGLIFFFFFFSRGSLFDCGVLGIDGGRYGIQHKYHEISSRTVSSFTFELHLRVKAPFVISPQLQASPPLPSKKKKQKKNKKKQKEMSSHTYIRSIPPTLRYLVPHKRQFFQKSQPSASPIKRPPLPISQNHESPIPERKELNRNPLSSHEALLPRGEKRKKRRVARSLPDFSPDAG